MAFSQRDLYSTAFDEFEHTYQHSYSHGLEKIYALENVDIRSVRKIENPAGLSAKIQTKKITRKQPKLAVEQLELPFGFPFQKTIEPFIFREPIQVLGFTKRVEGWLLGLEKVTIGDLLDNTRQSILPLTGIGQGHLDEICSKLYSYLEQNYLETPKLDFVSWTKTVMGDLEAKKSAVLLEAFELPALVHLSPAESAEVRKLTSENRVKWIEEALVKCQSPQKMLQVHSDMHHMAEHHLKPWLHMRVGMATLDELQECLFKLSGCYPYLQQNLTFFSTIYFQGHFPLEPFLTPVEDELYCDTCETAKSYQSVIETARTYFYRDHLHYPLDSLVGLISRELAQKWEGFADTFIERALRLSSCFRVRKGPSEQLIVKLS